MKWVNQRGLFKISQNELPSDLLKCHKWVTEAYIITILGQGARCNKFPAIRAGHVNSSSLL